MARDYTRLLAELVDDYTHYAPKSRALNERAQKVQVDGGSHALRLMQPFPPRIVAAHGAWLKDEDGHDILDLWQGHMANVLGHNPPLVTQTLARAFEEGFGLQTGFTDHLQAEVAEILCRQTAAERVRFTTSGTLATMYAVLLSRAFTGREIVMKVGSGWHGAQPWALKGIRYYSSGAGGFQQVESEGLPTAVTDQVIVTSFNDVDMLREHFRRYGDQAACFIVEPFLGVGGYKPATREFLNTVRELTHHYGVLLIFDEVISGFRFRAGDVGGLYGIRPDLASFGKIIGGGMPVAAVAGRAEVMDLAGRAGGSRVKFSGGTYSAHPASLLAAKTLMSYLVEHEAEVYPLLADLGEKARRTLAAAFIEEGIYARCTGDGGDVLSGSSMAYIHFPYQEQARLDIPRDWNDPMVCDVALSHGVLQLALLLEDVHLVNSHGALSTAHTAADIDFLGDACRRVARRVREHF
jgi:glutamate-1-semialdehyde 2,1-aminomutase